jgi:hypothetical protein
MNVEEVRALGRKLQAMQGEIDGIINRLNAEVNGTTWVGPDATQFKTQWWPEHQKHLRQMGVDLHGFGQSALNNASAQEQASGH